METPQSFRPEVRRALAWMVAFRFLINVVVRMTYTFLPAFARGTGMSVESMSRILSARELTSLTAPISGSAVDRHGTGRIMTWSGIVVLGGISLSLFGGAAFVVGMLVFGVGRTAYQISQQAWVGDEVAYQRRGRATGLIELSWGGTSLIGMPLVGLLIEGLSWRAPFFVLAVACVPVIAGLMGQLSSKGEHRRPVRNKLTFNTPIVGALAMNGAMTASAQFLFLGHGLWLEDTYNLNTAEVGFAVIAVGAVEVIATLGSARLTDVLGKRTSMLGGGVLMTAASTALALFPTPPLATGLLLLVLAFLGFEYAIVSAIPLMAELAPDNRARMIAVGLTVSSVSRAVITLVATTIYIQSGFATLMAVASVFGAAAVLLALTVMVEPTPASA